MGKRRAKWDYKHYIQYLKEGRGQGTGAAYKPFITIHDFPSRGVSARIPGQTTGRIHHLLSRNEEYYFYLLDYDPDVLDIREQFPLRLSETLEIANKLNIRHPKIGSFPYPITTDFLITRQDGLHARTVKLTSELDNLRTLEKFTIERNYWEGKKVDWKIVTEKQINRDRARNLHWLHSGKTVAELIPDPKIRENAASRLSELIDEKMYTFADIIEIIECAFSLSYGSGIALLKDLIRSGRFHMDLNHPIDFSNPIVKEE